ncbi:M35 family metallo-endopeptidase [Pseudoroseicyclus sp. CXY001]|uniref:M35 family metallo-endopeptidase n=1 Tax=Pseudoroseicyclus sp. CXY001 TaxID=3242492 RepID=UPI00357098ED
MTLRVLLAALLLVLPLTARAATFERCEKPEILIAEEAFAGAGAIVLVAAAQVGDTEAYNRWFGTFSRDRAEAVRTNLKAVNTALLSDEMVAVCPNLGEDGCLRDTYANVYPDQPYVINLCPNFFAQPNMTDHRPGAPELENGTREGTIIHEMSHFHVVADTDDLCYSRSECARMARRDALGAIRNADSYQYFAEDVTFYPAPRPDPGGDPLPDLPIDWPPADEPSANAPPAEVAPIDRTMLPRASDQGGAGCLSCRLAR